MCGERVKQMFKVLVLALALSFCGFAQQQPTVENEREAGLVRSVEKQELRHFELHRFFIPVTQGNLQWLASIAGAKPGEILFIWKLMREYDAERASRLLQTQTERNPA